MSRDQLVVRSKLGVHSFKNNADIVLLKNILNDAFKLRIMLYGAPVNVVRQCVQVFLEESFTSNYSNLKVLLRPVVRVEDFSVHLIEQFSSYIAGFSNDDIYQFLLKQLAEAANKRGVAPLHGLFRNYYWNAQHILLACNISPREFKNYKDAWKAFFKITRQKFSFMEQALRAAPVKSFNELAGYSISMGITIPITSEIAKFLTNTFFRVFVSNNLDVAELEESAQRQDYLTGAMLEIIMVLMVILSLIYVVNDVAQIDYSILSEEEFSKTTRAAHENYLIAQRAKLHVDELPLVQFILPEGPKSPMADDKSDEFPVARKPKRWHTAAETTTAAATTTATASAAAIQQIFESDNGTYIRLQGCPQGTFYHHNAVTQRACIDRKSGQEDQLLKTMLTVVTGDPTVHEAEHRAPGIKRVGVGEKKDFKGNYKIRFDGRLFGNLRIDVKERQPKAADLAVLGNEDCVEVLSPVGIVHK